MAYCIFCGKKIDDNKQCCEYCQSINQPNQNNQQPYQQISQNEYNPNQGYPQYNQYNQTQGYNYDVNNGYNQGYPQYQYQYPNQPIYNAQKDKSKVLSIIGMICSIFALSVGFIMFLQLTNGSVYNYEEYIPAGLLTLSCAIAGVVLSSCAKKQGLVNVMNGFAKGMGIPAIVMSALNIFIAFVVAI